MKHVQAYMINLLCFCVLLILLIGQSCKKFVEVDSSPVQILSTDVFSSDQSAQSALLGLYTQMTSLNLSFANGGSTVYPGLAADELYNTAPSSVYDPFASNALLPTTSAVNSAFWLTAYRSIYHANSLIEGASRSNSLSEGMRNQVTGEALLVRAFSHFYLTNLFGDVPLITSTDYKVNAAVGRTDRRKVYDQVIVDAIKAQEYLPDAYATGGRARPNRSAAAAFLARVYLYTENWEEAEKLASSVIDRPEYALSADLNSVFTPASKEAIWQLMRDNNNTAEAVVQIPSSATARPTIAIRPSLVTVFEPFDKRKTAWMGVAVSVGQTYYYAAKYKMRTSAPATENLMVLRLGEQYLLRAEARAQQNKITGAFADLNKVRNRAGLPSIFPSSKELLLAEIEKERQRELFAEWGHRWFDLKRTGRINEVLSSTKQNWEPSDALFPIPYMELQRNPFLTQNPGY